MTTENELLTTFQAAQRLSSPRQHILLWVNKGQLHPAARVGGKGAYRFDPEEVARFRTFLKRSGGERYAPLLTTEQVGQQLSCSPWSVRRLVNRSALQAAVRTSGRLLFDPDEVARYALTLAIPPGRLTTSQVAQRLGVHRSRVSQLVETGHLVPVTRSGRVYQFDDGEVERYAMSQRLPKAPVSDVDMAYIVSALGTLRPREIARHLNCSPSDMYSVFQKVRREGWVCPIVIRACADCGRSFVARKSRGRPLRTCPNGCHSTGRQVSEDARDWQSIETMVVSSAE